MAASARGGSQVDATRIASTVASAAFAQVRLDRTLPEVTTPFPKSRRDTSQISKRTGRVNERRYRRHPPFVDLTRPAVEYDDLDRVTSANYLGLDLRNAASFGSSDPPGSKSRLAGAPQRQPTLDSGL